MGSMLPYIAAPWILWDINGRELFHFHLPETIPGWPLARRQWLDCLALRCHGSLCGNLSRFVGPRRAGAGAVRGGGAII